MLRFPLLSRLCGALTLALAWAAPGHAGLLHFNQVVASAYHAPANRGACLFLATDGVSDTGSAFRGFDTFGSGGTSFAGLIHTGPTSVPRVIDRVTLWFGHQFVDGGAFASAPKLYLLVDNVDTDTQRPEASPHWIEYTAVSVTQSANVHHTFHLQGPVAGRTVYGFAVGGVNGSGPAGFLSVSELQAENAIDNPPLVSQPSALVASAFHSPDTMPECLALAIDGIVEPGGGGEFYKPNGFDTFAGELGAAQPDFAGLLYPQLQLFDVVTLTYGFPFGDGGRFAEPPRLFLNRNRTNTGTDNPDGNLNWREVTNAIRREEPDGVTFDLRALPDLQRQGYGWAIGGVKGDGTMGFISVSQLSAAGRIAPPSTDTDGDEMADTWEQQHQLTVGPNDGGLDPDGDGLTNLQEFQAGANPRRADTDGDGESDGSEVFAGTDPGNNSSFLRVYLAAREADATIIEWTTGTSLRYVASWSEDGVHWRDFGPIMVAGNWGFGAMRIQDPEPRPRQRFFRIRRIP